MHDSIYKNSIYKQFKKVTAIVLTGEKKNTTEVSILFHSRDFYCLPVMCQCGGTVFILLGLKLVGDMENIQVNKHTEKT